MTISDELKQVIRKSGFGQSELARQAGVPRVLLSRFLAEGDGHRDIRLEATVDKLAAFFGLKLVRDESAVQTIPRPKPQPQSKPTSMPGKVLELLATHSAGLTRKQIADLIETNGEGLRAIEKTLFKVKTSGKVRQNKRTGVYKLAPKSATLSRG